MMRKAVEVVAYDPSWPYLFDQEALLLHHALGKNCISLHHIGSTAVPGLASKPIIDIMAVIQDRAGVIACLEQVGYVYKGEYNIPFRLYFSKKQPYPFRLHVYETGNPEIDLNLAFRDYLRQHKEACQQYEKLKYNLIAYQALKFPGNPFLNGYTLGKDPFMKKILQRAGFQGLCIRICSYYEEWKTVKEFRQVYFFDQIAIKDFMTWTFDHPDHTHLVFYRGPEIIGFAHIHFFKEGQAVLKMLVLSEDYRQQGIGKYFLRKCEKWLSQVKGITFLFLTSHARFASFYKANGYQECFFEEVDELKMPGKTLQLSKKLSLEKDS